jgi:integrase
MPKGAGSIFKVKRGEHIYWCGQVQAGHFPDSGRRRYVTITRKRKADVLAEMDELRRRAGAGIVGKDQTVAELAREWLEVREGKVATGSLVEYDRRLRLWVIPHVGKVPLRKLTARDVRRMIAALEAEGLSPRSANMAKTTLSMVLKFAQGERRIEANPCDFVEGSRVGARLDDGLDDEEADAVLAAARDDRLYALLYLSLTLGLRQNEALGLRWTDVDLDAGEIRIDQSKTRSGERSLPLVASTHEALREHRRHQNGERLEAGPRWQDHEFVFCESDGSPIGPRDLVRWWHTLQEAAGISPRRRWHALRHSAVSRMLSRGVPLELASVVAGHSGIAVTADVYARWSKDAKRRELGRYLDAENS